MITSLSPSTDKPLRDSEDAASSSDSASDSAASTLFDHWGHDLGPESRRVALKKFRYFGYNGYLSDRISLTRPIPDLRPDGSVRKSICHDSIFTVCTQVISMSRRATQPEIISFHPFHADAETCLIPRTSLSSASSSSSSTRPYRCYCALSTRPSRGLRPTCLKRSYWWTTTATAVRIRFIHNPTSVVCGRHAHPPQFRA